MSGVFLVRATTADLEALVALAVACHSHPWTAAQIAAEVAAGPPAAVLVLKARGAGTAVVCASCAYRIAAAEMEILDVAVHPLWRRQGLGRFLVTTALGRAARAGATVARLEVREGNQPALRLYGALGFGAVGRRRGYYREPVEDALVMERALRVQHC